LEPVAFQIQRGNPDVHTPARVAVYQDPLK
jgi:hypothetical protein